MSEIAVMPLADYKGICNKVREKTGTTDVIKSGDMVSMLDAIGGGANEPYMEVVTSTVNTNYFHKAILYGFDIVYSQMFQNNAIVEEIDLSKSPNLKKIGGVAFSGCNKITHIDIPDSVEEIGTQAFQNCKALTNVVLPSALKKLGNKSFYNCTELTEVTFRETPDSIYNTAFEGCTKLLTINVPWASGEVSGAPWNATNATINYNYVEGGA